MNDHDLREAYAKLRESESLNIPRFSVWRRAPSLVVVPRRAWALAATLLIVIGAFMFRPKHQVAEVSISTWRAPTDFLLQTPGRELLVSVPQLQPQIPGGRS